MIDWKRVPWPLWLYSIGMIFGAIQLEVKVHGPVTARVLFAAIMLAWTYFLLKGVRWVWIVTIAIYVLGFLPDLISGSFTWWGIVLSLIGLMLLLLPVTRRYFSNHTVTASTRAPTYPPNSTP